MFLSHSFRFELPISTFSVSLELKMHDLHCQNILWLQFLSSNFHLGNISIYTVWICKYKYRHRTGHVDGSPFESMFAQVAQPSPCGY